MDTMRRDTRDKEKAAEKHGHAYPLKPRDMAITNALAAGETVDSIAETQHVHVQTVKRKSETFDEYIALRREDLARTFETEFVDATRTRLQDANNVDSKTAPQSYRGVAEAIGLIGNKTAVHIGDVNNVTNNVQVNVEAAPPTFDAAAHAELRRKLGVS